MLALSVVLEGCQSRCVKSRIGGFPGAALKCQSLFFILKLPFLERKKGERKEGRKRKKERERGEGWKEDGGKEGRKEGREGGTEEEWGLKAQALHRLTWSKGASAYRRRDVALYNMPGARPLPLSRPQFFHLYSEQVGLTRPSPRIFICLWPSMGLTSLYHKHFIIKSSIHLGSLPFFSYFPLLFFLPPQIDRSLIINFLFLVCFPLSSTYLFSLLSPPSSLPWLCFSVDQALIIITLDCSSYFPAHSPHHFHVRLLGPALGGKQQLCRYSWGM